MGHDTSGELRAVTPEGAEHVEVLLPRCLLGAVEEVSGDPLYQDGLHIRVTAFGGTLTFLDTEMLPLSVEPQGLVTFSVHVPLEPAEDAAATRAGFEGLVEKGVDVRIYVRRSLSQTARPYDVLSFTHEYGSFEVLIGPES